VSTRSLPCQADHRRRFPELLYRCRKDNQSRRTTGASPTSSPVLEQRPRRHELSSTPSIPPSPLVKIYATASLFLATPHREPFIVARHGERWRTPPMVPPRACARHCCRPGALFSYPLFDLRFGLEAKNTPSSVRSRWSISKSMIHVSPRLHKNLAARL
jgi:hypothetical protein